MEYKGIEIILVVSYMVCELYKRFFKEKPNFYKYIPIIVMITGGLLGIYLIETDNLLEKIIIGMISGLSSTGTNQIIKQIKKGE